ncbi:hypothetical protein D9757_011314 [Collybiopsis confluens]|uniref:Transposase n=1 Tax=Collybiopsis confluens TaxID=2823264 RepID=A0A8H5GP29_9AGAR|nr:hypothetical protein D9757_011314 [Collybiopsis confluens]
MDGDDKVVCQCSKCGGILDPVSARTARRHLQQDQIREETQNEEKGPLKKPRYMSPPRAQSDEDMAFGSQITFLSPPPKRPRIRRSSSLQPKLHARLDSSPVPLDDNARSSPPIVDDSASSYDPPSPAQLPNTIPLDLEDNDDGTSEGRRGQGYREDEQRDAEDAAARIAAAVMENLNMRSEQVLGDGLGAEGENVEEVEVRNGDETVAASKIEDIRIADEFIELLKNASLDNDGLEEHTLYRLRNPLENLPDELDHYTRLSIDMYLAITHASESTYNDIRDAIQRCFPDAKILSYYKVKNFIADITGVVAVKHDMCINSCHAFTGPFQNLEQCRYCHEPRYNPDHLHLTGEKVPRQQFGTILLGPQLAAIRRSSEGAEARMYRTRKLREIDAAIDTAGEDGSTMVWDDIWCGEDIQDLCERIHITEDDAAVSMSLDGAQLYQNKKSDCWIGIWINQDLSPKERFKKKKILPSVTIPGPNKPKHTDSFLFPSLHHISALQRENNARGILVWDAAKGHVVNQRIISLLTLADAVGIVEIDGRVTHHGALGCRLGCKMKGRHKPNSGHYYAAHAKPLVCTVTDNQHDDVDIEQLSPQSPEEYQEHLAVLRRSTGPTDYARNRKATGLSKPSILLGLHPTLSLPVPNDNKATWDWVKLVGEAWEQHGLDVENATQYFPSSFHRPPRNPTKKLSSGYKATEYYLYVFGLGPGLFRSILRPEDWRNVCKATVAIRTLFRYSLSADELTRVHILLVQFAEEYEHFYYQRREDRIHFCRPCIHTIAAHACPEVVRVGPGAYSTQFPMERTIGDLGQELKQPSNPYANLAERALRRAQVNALKAMFPTLDPNTSLPRGALDMGNGLVMLRPREGCLHRVEEEESRVLLEFFGDDMVRRWGRLRLPNGQIARSRFCETDVLKKRKPRVTRNVLLRFDDQINIAEVWYYFLKSVPGKVEESYALVSIYSEPYEDLWEDSSGALWACDYLGVDNLHIVSTQAICSVVSMQPLPPLPGEPNGVWFVVEKCGLDETLKTGHEEDMNLF